MAEHYERAMTRQAEQLQVKTLRSHVEQLAELGGRLQRQVNDLARDYAALADTLHGR